MRFEYGDVLRFTYDHQDVDASTGDKHKEVLVLHPNWKNKLQALDLKRLTPAERTVIDAVLDPAQKDKPHRLPLVNDIKRRLDPIMLIRNPMAFYTRFIKPFLRGKDAYRQYIPHRMSAITKVKGASIKTGKRPVDKPLFGPTPPPPAAPLAGPAGRPLTPIDAMKAAAVKKGLK